MPDVRARKIGAALLAICAIAGLAYCEALSPAAANNGVDASVRPGNDFYGFANGVWMKATHVPNGQSSIDSTVMLRAENARRVELLIEDAVTTATASGNAAKPDVRKIADYYAGRLDRSGIDARGMAPLSAGLAEIAAIHDRPSLATYLGRTLRLDDGTNTQTESLWGVWIHQDFHDPHHYAAHIVQGGLGLSDQDDYLGSAPERVEHRSLYRAHIAEMFRLAGLDRPEERAAAVLSLEVAIAGTHASRADTDDVFKTDNAWRHADFTAKAPGFDWPAFFAAARLNAVGNFVVWQPRSVIGGARLAATAPLDAWKDYFVFHLVEHYADVLPQPVSAERHAFEARLSGAPAAPPSTAQQALAATQDVLGDAMARLYVQSYFSAHAKAAATAMVDNIRTAWRAHLARLSWMSAATKKKAIAKLSALTIGLGYPENWVDYSHLPVVRGDAFGNFERAEAFAYARELAKFGRPVDQREWAAQLHPQMVGAILNISPNTMEFAAGLLQPPYFDPTGDTAANYGSAGAGIAHEITHSFDELGNQYDAQGRLAPWWTKDDLARYHRVADKLAAQLDAYCLKPDLCVHGKQVLAESAADLAGLSVAYDAYHLSLHGKRDAIKNGLTGDQRFFVGFAQRWRRLQSDAALRRQVATDSHAPPEFRGDIVRNMPEWIRAFGVKPGDRLYLKPAEQVRIW